MTAWPEREMSASACTREVYVRLIFVVFPSVMYRSALSQFIKRIYRRHSTNDRSWSNRL